MSQHPSSELEVVMLAGKILMESGAEIYRIESTMNHIAAALAINNFEAYVVNRGIIASATNAKGLHEAKVINSRDIQINLEKLESVNTLSRKLSQDNTLSVSQVYERLQAIDNPKPTPLWQLLIAYFLGASGFSLALGSSWGDSLVSGLTGLLLGLVSHVLSSKIHTGFIMTIIGSSVVTLAVNLFYLLGIGEHRSLIILGTLMILVPGAFFVNAIREFSQNNFSAGVSLLMSALVICSSISVGVAATLAILPFAEQMTGTFSATPPRWLGIVIRTITAGIGTVAFAILYQVPRCYYRDLGLLGAGSWLVYMLLAQQFHKDALSVFGAALLVALCSRILAAKRRCPATIFLATSMFPLIPGLSIYRAVYFLLTANNELAQIHLRAAFIAAFAIAIAIAIIQQIPLSTFKRKQS